MLRRRAPGKARSRASSRYAARAVSNTSVAHPGPPNRSRRIAQPAQQSEYKVAIDRIHRFSPIGDRAVPSPGKHPEIEIYIDATALTRDTSKWIIRA
jgi:hypothetical protein